MTQFRRFCPYLPICWLLRFFFLKVNIKSWTRSSPPWHIVCDSWLYKPICPLTNVRFWKQSQQSEARTIIASHHHTFLIFPSFSWIFIVLHIVLCVGDRQARSDIWKIWFQVFIYCLFDPNICPSGSCLHCYYLLHVFTDPARCVWMCLMSLVLSLQLFRRVAAALPGMEGSQETGQNGSILWLRCSSTCGSGARP